jgi:hypothetical protein
MSTAVLLQILHALSTGFSDIYSNISDNVFLLSQIQYAHLRTTIRLHCYITQEKPIKIFLPLWDVRETILFEDIIKKAQRFSTK